MAEARARILLTLLLRPIARFCLKHGLRIQEIESTFKAVLAEEAIEELESRGEQANPSRLSLITGIARKLLPGVKAKKSEALSIMAKVIDRWQRDPAFYKPSGETRAIDAIGETSEFHSLVKKVSSDINPYSVLKELERLNLVAKVGGKVKLLRTFALSKDSEQVFDLVSKDMETLLKSAEHNISQTEDCSHLHLSTYYDNIPDIAVDKLRIWVRAEGSKFHSKLRKFISSWDKDLNPEKSRYSGRNSIRVGSQSFINKIENKKNDTF